MKIYAQHGFGDGTKTFSGLSEDLIDGVIFSPKDITPDTFIEKIESIKGKDVLIDPQLYVSLYARDPNIKLGKLIEWDFFKGYRRSHLENIENVNDIIDSNIEFQLKLPVTSIVTPNIYISKSFDSIECSIAKNMIRNSRKIYNQKGDNRDLYASLIISRDALLDQRELNLFLNDLTALSESPDGFYLIIGSRSTDVQSDIYNTDVIAAWMLLNYSLSINGYKVINGYSDLLTPLLGVTGGYAGSTGWWSNLRTFSMERFIPSRSGGRQPVARYLSLHLHNRITFVERNAFSTFIPEVTNDLSTDQFYNPEPSREEEILQSWEALNALTQLAVNDNMLIALDEYKERLKISKSAYLALKAQGVSIDSKSDDTILDALSESIDEFKKRAEVN